ncbi:MAG: DUF2085 domain-containing protein, partial [Blastocatellia bacterium]
MTLAGAGAWLGLIAAIPWLHETAPLLALALRQVFSSICHQIPERSVSLFGHALPVCARCLGIYAGALFGLTLIPPGNAVYMPRRRWLLAGIAPLLLDVLLNETGLLMNTT